MWFFGDFDVIDDCLSDVDVFISYYLCNLGKYSWLTGIFGYDFKDVPFHFWCHVFEMTGWFEFTEDVVEFFVFFNSMNCCFDGSSV